MKLTAERVGRLKPLRSAGPVPAALLRRVCFSGYGWRRTVLDEQELVYFKLVAQIAFDEEMAVEKVLPVIERLK